MSRLQILLDQAPPGRLVGESTVAVTRVDAGPAAWAQQSPVDACGARAIVDDALMPADTTAPLGAARRRGARPADVAVLGGLVGGAFGADALAAPWSVGVASSGALADPGRSARPMQAVQGAHLARLQERRAPIFMAMPQGGPDSSDEAKIPWQLAFSRTSGFPWGIGHWPLFPRVGVGGQGSYSLRQVTLACLQVTPQSAAAIAQRMGTWWWPAAHRLGLDIGPLALPLPSCRYDDPLQGLAADDSIEVTRIRHAALSVGLVFKWLRVGPQRTVDTAHTLSVRRQQQLQGVFEVAYETKRSTRLVPLMLDLPALASAASYKDGQTVLRKQWALDLHTAVGKLSYQLIAHQFAAFEPAPHLPGAAHTLGSLHEGMSRGCNAMAYLPWTLLQRHVRGVGLTREWGAASVEHLDGPFGGHSLWVENESESWANGQDGWRIGVHSGFDAGHVQNNLLWVGMRLHIEQLQRRRREQLVLWLVDGLGMQLRSEVGHAPASAAALPRDMRLTVNFALSRRRMQQAMQSPWPMTIALAAERLGVQRTAAQQLCGGLLTTLEGPKHALQDTPSRKLEALLRAHGPTTLALIWRWLGEPDTLDVAVSYNETQALVADAMQQAACSMARVEVDAPRGGHQRAERLDHKRAAKALERLADEVNSINADPLLALCPVAVRTAQLQQLDWAQSSLLQAFE